MILGETQPFASPGEALLHNFDKKVEEIKEGRTDEELARLGALGQDFLEHYGVKGMKWGVRKADDAGGLRRIDGPDGVPAKTNRRARKDAEEFTKAKMYYGEGAGTRRKLIKAKVEAESKKDPLYKKAFDYHVAKTDMSKRSKQAVKTRKRTDRKQSVKKNLRKSGINDLVRDAAVTKILEQDDISSTGQDYLTHYGVKGMKWGVRKERETSGRESGKGQVGVDPVTVAVVTMYAAMVAKTALFAYRYSKDGGEKIAEKNKDVPWKKNPDLAKKMDVNGLEKNVVKQVNPDFPKAGTKMNCRRCTLAYEMRRRGYDVTATKSRYAKGQDDIGLREALGDKNKKYDSVWGEKQIDTPDGIARADSLTRGKKIFDALDTQPEGARGELGVGWFPMGGHSVAWEKVNGKAVIFDTQSGKTYRNPRDFKELSDVLHDAAYTRTDNKQINEQFIRRWATNVER